MEKNTEIVIKIVNHKYKDDHAVKDLIRYILTKKKNRNMRKCLGGKGVCYLNWEKAVEEFEIIQEYYGKKQGRRIYHMVISFAGEEKELYKIYMFGQRVIENIFEGYQCVFAVHEETDNLHIHIAWNAVSYRNGKKWHSNKEDVKNIKNKIIEIWDMS